MNGMRDDSFNILQIDSKMFACFPSSMFYIRLQNKKGSKNWDAQKSNTFKFLYQRDSPHSSVNHWNFRFFMNYKVFFFYIGIQVERLKLGLEKLFSFSIFQTIKL